MKTYLKKILVLIACAVGFAFLAFDISGSYRCASFDTIIYNTIRQLESPFFTGFFKLMTNMVNPVVMLVISVAMIHILKHKEYLVALLGNLLLAVLLNLAIKGSFMRSRPPEDLRLVYESGYSFPSGHSMVAACFYGFLIFMIWQANIKKSYQIIGTIFSLIMIVMVGMSRIYLGVHYGTDVIGGFLVSTIYLIIYTTITKKYLEGDNLKLSAGGLLAKHKLVMSFQYAFNGIIEGVKNERNMMIHYAALVLVIVFGITLKLSVVEWSICLILCALVISLELVNTAIEAVVDLVTKEKKALAKLAKDTAAGAVLIAAITAAIIGGIIFIPKIILLFT